MSASREAGGGARSGGGAGQRGPPPRSRGYGFQRLSEGFLQARPLSSLGPALSPPCPGRLPCGLVASAAPTPAQAAGGQ